jgi:hypothetical protein
VRRWMNKEESCGKWPVADTDFVFVGRQRHAVFGGFAVECESTVECGCDCTGDRYVRCERELGGASG